MPLDPAAAAILEMMKQMPSANPPFSVEGFRMGDSQPMPFPKAEVAEVRDISLDADGRSVGARLYHPAPGTRLPVLFFLHGGGWIACTLDTHDSLCRALAARSGAAVVSIDYPRAPESCFPGPLEASDAALRAAVASAESLGIDAGRIAVAGDSAGGNLAAALCLVARDRGEPAIAHQLLFYPVIEPDFTRDSYRANGADYFLTTPMMRFFWEQYLGGAAQTDDPRAAPLRAASLEGLPPATIITAEFDPLRDEGAAYAEGLRAAGVPVRHELVPGVFHGFASMVGALPQAEQALGIAAEELRKALALDQTP